MTLTGNSDAVVQIDPRTARERSRCPVPAGACAPILAPGLKRLFVCSRFDHSVGAFALPEGDFLGRLPAVREPVAAALSPDESWLVVANHLPAQAADGKRVAACVTLIDARSWMVRTNLALPNGSVALRGVSIAPGGRYACVTHNVARFQAPAAQVEHGWMNDSAVSVIDLQTLSLRNTVFLDEPERGAANPWATAWTPDARHICVAHSGTHELSLLDAETFLEKLKGSPRGRLLEDMEWVRGLRRRLPLELNGPRSLAVIGDSVVAAGFFSDSLTILDRKSGAVTGKIQLGETGPEDRRQIGERLFHDATIGRKSWQSCASCHPDGRTDGLNWDLLNDGIGNPKNTKSMVLSHRTPPAMSTGVRGTAEDAVRSGLRNILFALRPEEEAAAIDTYLQGLEPLRSPTLVEGKLSERAQRGKALFEDPAIGCAACHPAPLYTDCKSYDVGTARPFDGKNRKFDTPTLVEVWRTAPYLHDGSQTSVRGVLTDGNPRDRHGRTSQLTPEQIEDLAAFVMSL